MNKKKELIMFMPFIGGGGVEKNLFIIANFLSKKIDKVTICTISKNKKKKFNDKINFLIPKKNTSNIKNIRIKYLLALYELFKYLLIKRDAIVISFQANIYCIIICKLLNIKIIVRSNSSPEGWYHNWIKKMIYKKIISMADKVIVNSLDFKKQMEKKFNIQVDCIFNPLDLREIIKKSKYKIKNNFYDKGFRIINIGRMTEQKDQITILKAINILKDKFKFKLIILGRGSEKEKLLEFIKKNKLEKLVKLIDFIENPYPYLKSANLFVLSSKYEGLPNVLLEAASLKKLIISTDCPTGPREILNNGKGGILFSVGNYEELSRKILLCYRNKKKFNTKIKHNFKNLKRYDFNENINKYFLLIKSVLIKN